jgi:hypothetical protein
MRPCRAPLAVASVSGLDSHRFPVRAQRLIGSGVAEPKLAPIGNILDLGLLDCIDVKIAKILELRSCPTLRGRER